MEKLRYEPTSSTPGIELDPISGQFKIWGRSLPENSHEFFRPVHEWIEAYLANPQDESSLQIELEYFNTSSTAHILKLLKKLEELDKVGGAISVFWTYDREDEDMKEAGEDFATLTSLPIQLLQKA